MSTLYPVVITACGAVLVCSVLSNFISEAGSRRILSLVMGAFIVCSMILPVFNAVSGFKAEIEDIPSEGSIIDSYDELFETEVVYQTKENLEKALRDLLAQNNIEVNDCEIILAVTDENSIIISAVYIYIDRADYASEYAVRHITEQELKITPNIITE